VENHQGLGRLDSGRSGAYSPSFGGENLWRKICRRRKGRAAAWVWEGDVSDNEDRTVKRSRLRVRHLLPLAVLALVPILLAPAGSAKPAPPVINFGICVQNATTLVPAPSCSGADTNSEFDGATGAPGAPVQVTITNAASSTAALGTVKIDLPSGLRVDPSVTPQPSKYVTANGSSEIQVIGTQIQAGKSLLVTFSIDTGCDGSDLAWTASASPFNGTGSSTSQDTLSVGEKSNLRVGCHLRFATQPTDTQVGSTITDKGASTGGAIKVELDQGDVGNNTPMTTCPFGAGNCKVKVNDDPTNVGSFTPVSNAVGETFTASFSNLKITNPLNNINYTVPFTLTATGDLGLTQVSVASNPFLITEYAQGCTGNGCSFSRNKLTSGDITSFASLAGGATFDFMTLSSYSLDENNLPAGCQDRIDLHVTGFAETDGRNADGAMTITYYVNMDNIKANYGTNVGQQFIAMCVGAKKVVNNAAVDCRTLEVSAEHPTGVGGSENGWLGDSLTGGKFDGGSKNAICDADGFYWGIISSYQDKLPTDNPIVTSWSGQNIAGKNYRAFVMNVPSGWDYRNGP
jgi:hypothetical protein